MDAADASASDSAMIALLPTTTDWCKSDLPHMTVVYAGLITDLKPGTFNDLAKDAASIAMLSPTITLRVMGVDVFGDVEKVNVLRLQPSSEIMAMRQMVDHWNASEYTFSPHATVGPFMQGVDVVPQSLSFDRVYVGWGNDCLTFRMRSY